MKRDSHGEPVPAEALQNRGGPEQRRVAARARILACLEELDAIKTHDDARGAKELGVAFSIEGFRRRAWVSQQCLRSQGNACLFYRLKFVLQLIHEKLVRAAQRAGTRRNQASK